MDTQVPSNCHLVSEIKSEAVTYGLYEAFLESAPQLILQLSIVLRSGFISENIYFIFFLLNHIQGALFCLLFPYSHFQQAIILVELHFWFQGDKTHFSTPCVALPKH